MNELDSVIVLKNDGWEIGVLPSRGAMVTFLRHNGTDILRPLEDIRELDVNPYLWGSPVLVPANRTDGGKFVFEGKEYHLPLNEARLNNNLHGILYKLNFPTVKTGPDRAVSRFENRNGQGYPFDFDLEIVTEVSSNGALRSYTFTNTGTTDMPLTFATHTTFVENGTIRVPLLKADRRNERHIPLYYDGLNELERSIRDGVDPHGLTISGYYTSCGNTARCGNYDLTVSGDYDHWILYNKDGLQGYICIEPQAGRSNGMNNCGYIFLRPGESRRFSALISLHSDGE